MHFGAAQFFLCGDLAGCGLEQGRASQKSATIALDRYDVITEPGHVGAAGG